MPRLLRPVPPRKRARRTPRLFLRLEELEARHLLSGLAWPGLLQPQGEVEGNDTLDQAQNLGPLGAAGRAEVVGAVGNSPAGAADVDFYRFTLGQPTHVHVTTLDREAGSPLVSVLSLYNSDPLDSLGHRLIAQDDGAADGGDAVLDTTLGAGTYFLAVSGSGNRYFNPLLADSGYAGSTGAYGLQITASPAGWTPGDGPAVLATDPGPGSSLLSSPLLLRLDLSGPADPNTLVAGSTVLLTYNAAGAFGNGADQPVALSGVTFDGQGDVQEIQVTPAAPLAPGFYQLFLAGNEILHPGAPVVAAPDGTPLGKTAASPAGQDYALTFQVAGIEGTPAPAQGSTLPPGLDGDDLASTAHDLGAVAGTGLVQVAGAIGDDPTDPVPFNPSDVDFYHFQVRGTGRFALGAEVFAGRIGSTLDPALTLFRVAADGSLEFVAGNYDTLNSTPAANGAPVLYSDAAFTSSLTAGDYYLAVSSGLNAANPAFGILPGAYGAFDPTVSHSGSLGNSVGRYVLNLRVDPGYPAPPHVLSTSVPDGAVLSGPPGTLNVAFDAPVNLQDLAFQAYATTGVGQMAAVLVQDANGVDYFPRLGAYDPATNQATLVMLDALPDGDYTLHLSGPLGLADLAGNPLAGNDPSGDYVVHFRVECMPRGTPGNPTAWLAQEPNDDPQHPQVLGTLFPLELANGVTVTRDYRQNPSPGVADTADYYQFTVLQDQFYSFALTNTTGLPAGTVPLVMDASGNPLVLAPAPNGALMSDLPAGTYILGVTGWTARDAADVSYQLSISLISNTEMPTALTTGPAPMLRMRLVMENVPAPVSPAGPGAPSGDRAPTSETPPFPVLPPLPQVSPGTLTVLPADGPEDLAGDLTPISAAFQASVRTASAPASLHASLPAAGGLVAGVPGSSQEPAAIPPGLLVGLSEGPLGGGSSTGFVSGPFLAEPTAGTRVSPILVQAFVSLGVVAQFSGGGGDDASPAGQGSGPGISWSGLEGMEQRARDTILNVGGVWVRSGLALAREVKESLRALDLVFALASGETSEEPPALPPAAAVAGLRVSGDAIAVAAPGSTEPESDWLTLTTLGRAGVVLLSFAAAAFCGMRYRDRSLTGQPALKGVLADHGGNDGRS